MARSKQALKDELLAAMEATRQGLLAAHADALEAATHAEAKPENDKDTRALEQSYLARGQAMRIEALTQGIAELAALDVSPSSRSRLGSLVSVRDEAGRARHYFLAPEGGGTRLAGGVQVVTPVSPLGVALTARCAGDEVEVALGKESRLLVVVEVG